MTNSDNRKLQHPVMAFITVYFSWICIWIGTYAITAVEYLCNYTVFQIVEPPWPYIKQNGIYQKGDKLENSHANPSNFSSFNSFENGHFSWYAKGVHYLKNNTELGILRILNLIRGIRLSCRIVNVWKM